MTERCAHCWELAPLADLIEVTLVAEPWRRFWVHRASRRAGCFRLAVRGADVDRIAMADRSAA